jgi:hypothetical protein
MLGSHNSIFDSPSFIQKIMKKKSSSKYNIRPLYTADIVAEVGPWKKQLNAATTKYSFSPQKKTKTYNQPSFNAHQQPLPALSPSVSSTTASSILSESAIIMPIPSSSTPITQQSTTKQQSSQRKRPLSSEILIKIMDQRLLKKQQRQQQEMLILPSSNNSNLPQLHRSASSSTTVSNSNINTTRLNKLLPNKPTASSSTTIRRNSATRQQGNTTATMRHLHHQQQTQQTKKLKTSKSVLNKLNHYANAHQLITEWPYVLTQDNDEQDRMVAQHYLLRTAFGSDFTSPIKSALQRGIVVLDVGCGAGVWTMEMSTAFPKSTFIGIDQGAFYPRDIKPRNCHFRTCGSLVQHQLPLPFPDNSIDYIYQRDINWGLTGQTWQPLLQEYQRILKPGGWIEFVEPVSSSYFIISIFDILTLPPLESGP